MKKASAKERILETAGDLFFQRGYSNVGINEIIEKAGTAKASFYQHYPSKESLCEEWLRTLHEQSAKRRAELLASPKSAEDKIETYFDMLENFLITSDFRGCPYSNTGAVSDENCPGIAALIRAHKESIRSFMRTVAAMVFSDPTQADEIGDRMFLLYSGATGEAQNLREIWPVRVAKAAAMELIRI